MSVYNMQLTSYSMEVNEFGKIMLEISINGERAGCCFDVPFERIPEIFELFEINNLKELDKCYCRAFFDGNILRKIMHIIKSDNIYLISKDRSE